MCELDTVDISTISPYCDQYSLMPTPVPGAFRKRWILERPKNSPPDCFYPGCAGASLSNPVHPSKKFHPGWGGTFLSRLDTIDISVFYYCTQIFLEITVTHVITSLNRSPSSRYSRTQSAVAHIFSPVPSIRAMQYPLSAKHTP